MSNYLIPLLVIFIIVYGLYKKVDIYDTFIDGAKESFDMVFHMFPNVIGMVLGVNIFVKSGVLDIIFGGLTRVITFIPAEVLTLGIVRPISGSAALAMLNNLLNTFGPDSIVGKVASVMQGSTDTTLYVISLYFGTVGVKKIKNSLWVALIADLISIIGSIIIVNLFINH